MIEKYNKMVYNKNKYNYGGAATMKNNTKKVLACLIAGTVAVGIKYKLDQAENEKKKKIGKKTHPLQKKVENKNRYIKIKNTSDKISLKDEIHQKEENKELKHEVHQKEENKELENSERITEQESEKIQFVLPQDISMEQVAATEEAVEEQTSVIETEEVELIVPVADTEQNPNIIVQENDEVTYMKNANTDAEKADKKEEVLETGNVSEAEIMPKTGDTPEIETMPKTGDAAETETMPETRNVFEAKTMPKTGDASEIEIMPETGKISETKMISKTGKVFEEEIKVEMKAETISKTGNITEKKDTDGQETKEDPVDLEEAKRILKRKINWQEADGVKTEIDYSRLPAAAVLNVSGLSLTEIKSLFTIEEISEEIFKRIYGKSYKADCIVPKEQLRYLRMLYYGFDDKTHVGEMIVNVSIAEDIKDIFYLLYQEKYQIERMVLVDEYHADDVLSMAANNTSSFNYRKIDGMSVMSKHSRGMAVDINPKQNPYVRIINGEVNCQPQGGEIYMDREKDFPHKIDHEDLCYCLFRTYGFTWGGDWEDMKDYQHFQKQSSLIS